MMHTFFNNFIEGTIITLITIFLLYVLKKLFFKIVNICLTSFIKKDIFINNCSIPDNLYPGYKIQLKEWDNSGILISLVTLTTNMTMYYDRLSIKIYKIKTIDYIGIIFKLLALRIPFIFNSNTNNYINISLSKYIIDDINKQFGIKINEQINGLPI